MKNKYYLFFLGTILFLTKASFAQIAPLPVKKILTQTVYGAKVINSNSAVDTIFRAPSFTADFTMELVCKVNSAIGRGMDIEVRDAEVKGFRLSLDATSLNWTSKLNNSLSLSAAAPSQEQTVRVAVKSDTAYVFHNGNYIFAKPMGILYDILDGVEGGVLQSTKQSNLIPGWAGVAPNNTGLPSDYGWAYVNATTTTLFAAANATTAGTSRFLDVNESSGSNIHTLNGASFDGRIFYIRWDANATSAAVYGYPVTLEANTTYDFSMLHGYVSNATGGKSISVGIGKTTAASDRLDSHTFQTSGTRDLKQESFVFRTKEAGLYYLTFTGDWGLYSIANLSLNKITSLPHIILGKNYVSGAVDMEIISVKSENGAFAPEAASTGGLQDVVVTGRVASYSKSYNTNFIVSEKTDLHFTDLATPFVNSTVQLNNADAWLFFDHIRPSTVLSSYLDKVLVNGTPAKNNPNVRVSIYKNGTVVIPYGNIAANVALEVFTQPFLQGDTKSFEIKTYHTDLASFDNKIRSFKLKRGFMATLANNNDGSGFSRVFIANDSDLIVTQMPLGLDTTVSFIRVFKWDWISKKGKAGGGNPVDLTQSTWYYDWNIAGSSTNDHEYVAIRQNSGWPSWTAINTKEGVNHLSGFNEPDRPDQANMTVDQCIAQWPNFMKSGMRVGSPSPATPQSSWITDFLTKCDALNYRVDYVTIHCYWGGLSPAQWYAQLKTIYDRVRRPLWITEWNNGANWTTEAWPTDQTAQFAKQLNDMKGILQVLDTTSFVERYAIYDWVENKRAMVLADTLTPAGKYYAANPSNLAFTPAKAYVHEWKLLLPSLFNTIQSDDYFKTTISWKNMNGEMGGNIELQRLITGKDTDYKTVATYSGNNYGSTMNFNDSIYGQASYRLKVFIKDGLQFDYSDVLVVSRDVAATAPASITGSALAASVVKLDWTAVSAARSYNVKRSLQLAGPYTTISARTPVLTLTDTALNANTTYYYLVTSLNSSGESAPSNTLTVTTKKLLAPDSVSNARVASGDNRVTATWDFLYDASYEIARSVNVDGPFTILATNVKGQRFDDSTASNNTTYYYKLNAFNSAGRSTKTQVFRARPLLGQHIYVKFDEAQGSFFEDSWGGYHGMKSSAVLTEIGRDGGALKLDGTSNAYVSLSNGLFQNISNYTISAWVRFDALSTWMRIFDIGNGTSNYLFLTPQSSVASGLSNIRFAIKNGATENQLNFATTLPLNTWTHLAIVGNGTTVTMFLNGVSVASSSSFTLKPADLNITTNNFLGRSQFSADPNFNGAIDDFKVFNYALSAAEIAQTLKSNQVINFSPMPNKFVGDADFNPGASASSGLTISYSSSNTAVATIVNGAVHIVGEGTTQITASQLGGVYYLSAMPVSQTLVVSPKSVTGVRELPNEIGVRVFPNPVSEIAFVQLPQAYASADIKLLGKTGQTILMKHVNATQFDLPMRSLQKGIYYLQIHSKGKLSTVKLLKE